MPPTRSATTARQQAAAIAAGTADEAAVSSAPLATGEVDDEPELRHKRGCPRERIESYNARRPQSQGGALIVVTRCIDCGRISTEDD